MGKREKMTLPSVNVLIPYLIVKEWDYLMRQVEMKNRQKGTQTHLTLRK